MDCRSLFRSSETDPTSVHTQSHKPHRYRKRRALATVMASAAMALSVLIVPAPQADAVYSNPTGGEGRYPQAIDWIDWAELSNTTTEVASGRSYKILPAGSSGFTWSSPTQISSNLWRTSRCTISDIRGLDEVWRSDTTQEPGAEMVWHVFTTTAQTTPTQLSRTPLTADLICPLE